MHSSHTMQYIGLPGRFAAQVLLLATLTLSLSGCTRLFFYPMPDHVMVPSDLGYDYEDVFLVAADGTRLHGWLLSPGNQPALGSVYFLHGNAENISTHFRATTWLVDAGYEVFALDYRGYGWSDGKPDVPQVFDDIASGARWLEQRNRESGQALPLYLYGQSLGASLAITYASREARFNQIFSALLSEAAFSRFDTIARDVASRHWLTWSAQYPVQWLITRRHDPLDAIARLDHTPKLLIHSQQDEIIPYRFGQKLLAAAAEPRQWLEATGHHIRAAADPTVRSAMLEFMQRSANPAIEPVH